MMDHRYIDRRGDVTITIRGDRHGGLAYVVVDRMSRGVTHSIGLRAGDVEQICEAMRAAARDAAHSEADDASRARQMLGVTVRGR